MSFLKTDGSLVDFDFENSEQQLCRKYIPKDASVLELGARYGTVSYVINKILDDPTKHVAVDPDTSIIPALERNRDVNGCKFHIFNGIISENNYEIARIDAKFNYAEYGTYTKLSDKPSLNSISLDKLQQKYNIKFNCLVADCEGFLYDFLHENIWFLDQLHVIIYEQDGSPWYLHAPNYELIDKILIDKKFTRVESIAHPYYKNNINNHSVWIK